MLRPLLVPMCVLLAGCAGAALRPPACTDASPGRSTYEVAQVGGRRGEGVTVFGLLSDVDSGRPIGPAANVVAIAPASLDSVVAGADADSSGRLAFDVAPGPTSFEARALGYVGVRTGPVALPPGSIWAVRFRMHQACPDVG